MVASRRCRSVPPSVVDLHYDYGYGEPAALKAHRIHQYVVDDHDALSRASRRQDAALLSDINARMDATDYRATPLFRHSRARAYSPPPAVVMLGASLGASHLSRSRHQRASSVPPSFRETECSTDSYYPSHSHHPSYYGWRRHHFEPESWQPSYQHVPSYHTPITSYVSQRVRAGSEPPFDRGTTVHHEHHGHHGHHGHHHHPGHHAYVPSADLAVRTARGALSRLERELSSGWDDPYYHHDHHDHHDLYDHDYDYDYLHTPVRPYRQVYPLSGGSTSSYHHHAAARPIPRSPSLPRYSRAADIESHLDSMIIPDHYSSYAGLRSRAADAHGKMDHHKVLLDRYLPIHLGPEPEVGMHHLDHYKHSAPATPSYTPATPSYTPSYHRSTPPAPKPVSAGRRMSLPSPPPYKFERLPVCRPPVSDARKRAREVLCKTKRDPGYYDY